jgi:hypothetical protein
MIAFVELEPTRWCMPSTKPVLRLEPSRRFNSCQRS